MEPSAPVQGLLYIFTHILYLVGLLYYACKNVLMKILVGVRAENSFLQGRSNAVSYRVLLHYV